MKQRRGRADKERAPPPPTPPTILTAHLFRASGNLMQIQARAQMQRIIAR